MTLLTAEQVEALRGVHGPSPCDKIDELINKCAHFFKLYDKAHQIWHIGQFGNMMLIPHDNPIVSVIPVDIFTLLTGLDPSKMSDILQLT